MNDGERSFSERLDLLIALRRFDRAFEACANLSEVDKNILYQAIARRVLPYIPRASAEAETPAEEPRTVKIVGVQIK